MKINIDNMNLSDLTKIENCLLQDFDDFWSPSILRQELENSQKLNSNYFVAKCNSEILGFAGILTIIDEVNIMNIVVKKSNRGLGVGSLLLEKIIDFSKSENASSITLEVNENNIVAIKLYEKYGFKQVGLRKKYYNNIDNAILLDLKL